LICQLLLSIIVEVIMNYDPLACILTFELLLLLLLLLLRLLLLLLLLLLVIESPRRTVTKNCCNVV
jgi:hypothetical protein